MTRLAVAILVESVEHALAAAALAAERGADLVEYRLDRFTDRPDEVAELVEESPLPCIATIRPAWEGGGYEGDEEHRLALLERIVAGPRPPVYIDVELAAFQRSPEVRRRVAAMVDHPERERKRGAAGTGLILSSHDFQTRPADLLRRVEAMAAEPCCRVIKLAWAGRSLRDNTEAFELLAASHKPTIALCMGRFGLPSRVLAGKFGALLTFAALEPAAATAPGQPAVAEMKDLYRWDAIDRETRVYGVIGWPVEHSMSPAIHNAGFESTGHNGVYLPLPIPPEYEHFKATVGTWLDHAPLHFRGASVTIPHKGNLLRFVAEMGGEVEPLAERIGAANTLTVRKDGSLHASNTDYAAALDAVCAAMGIERGGLAGKRVAVIGAGGAARAVVVGFAGYGASVTVYNRTIEKAEALAEAFGDGSARDSEEGEVVAAPLANLPASHCDIYINCTPIGMHPHTDATPIEAWPDHVDERTVVFDTIYNPIETRLLREAREAGCITASGLEMFIRQAAAQFEQWTAQPAPVETFERIVRERLAE